MSTSDFYQRHTFGNFGANVDFLLQSGLLSKDKKILEIGSGRGALVHYLTQAGYDVIGSETSVEAINFARKNFSVELKPLSGEMLDFPSTFFDLVLSFDVFEHIYDSNRHLQEVRRILKPGGYYLFGTPNKWTNIPAEIVINRNFSYRKYHPSLHHFWSLKKRLRVNGFEPIFGRVRFVNNYFIGKICRIFGLFFGFWLIWACRFLVYTPFRNNFYVQAQKKIF